MNLVVVLPLRPGARDRARDLLRHGPPFDPDEAGLERHQAFVSDTEVVFLFEADARQSVLRLVDDASLWEAAEGWTELVAGPPRLAERRVLVDPTSPAQRDLLHGDPRPRRQRGRRRPRARSSQVTLCTKWVGYSASVTNRPLPRLKNR